MNRKSSDASCTGCETAVAPTLRALADAFSVLQSIVSGLKALDPSVLMMTEDIAQLRQAIKEGHAIIHALEHIAPSQDVPQQLITCLEKCGSSVQATLNAFQTLDKDAITDLVAKSEDLTSSISTSQRQMDKLIEYLDSITAKSFSGGGESRFQFTLAVGKDPGQPNYFGCCPEKRPSFEEAVSLCNFNGYFVCTGCNKGIASWSIDAHMRENHEGVKATVPMTSRWVLDQCSDFPEDKKAIHAYTLESPLCYDGNRSMRQITGQARNPFESPKDSDRLFTESLWGYEKYLHEAMMSLPDESSTVFRAVNFNVSSNLYETGKIVTWNQPSSTSSDPRVVKRFLGSSGDVVKGTIFIIHVKHGKSISAYSQYKDEKEVLLYPNTQLRVLPPVGKGVKDLVATALRCDLTHVAIVEMAEVSLNFWKDFEEALTPAEAARLRDVIRSIRHVEELEREGYPSNISEYITYSTLIEYGGYPMDYLPYPDLFTDVLSVDTTMGVWSVLLHRMSSSQLDRSLWSPLILAAFGNLRLKLVYAHTDSNTYRQYSSGLPVLGLCELLLDKFGLSAIESEIFQSSKGTAPALLLCLLATHQATDADILRVAQNITSKHFSECLPSIVRDVSCSGRPCRLGALGPLMKIEAVFDLCEYAHMTAYKIAAYRGACDYIQFFKSLFAGDFSRLRKQEGDGDGMKYISALYLASRFNQCEALKCLLGNDMEWTRQIYSVKHINDAAHWACVYCSFECLQVLIPIYPMEEIDFPKLVESASFSGRMDVVWYLLALKPSSIDQAGGSVYFACQEGHLEIAQHLLNLKPELIHTIHDDQPLIYAPCLHGYLKVFDWLYSMQPTMLGKCTKNPLNAACEKGNLEFVRRLLTLAPHLLTSDCMKAAVRMGHVHVVRYLEAVNPALLNSFRPLIAACSSETESVAMVKYIAERNAEWLKDVSESGDQCSPFHYACDQGHLGVVTYLYSIYPEYINMRNSSGATPLHAACDHGYLGVIKFLCRTKPELLDEKDSYGSTPFQNACESYDNLVPVIKYFAELRESLLDTRFEEGDTLLAFACVKGSPELVEFVLEKRPEQKTIPDAEGRLPLELAKDRGSKIIIRMLEDKNENVNPKEESVD